ncbi:MAG TPA: AAA family ATPase, partial [Pyrinomonadaceae bacterium]|nr:AAA family ATPase [Pyrinomonadaceae bacterium]
MQLREVVSRFEGAKKTGNGFVARCPAHQDNHQSLSLAESDGRILMNCFAGCTAAAIVSCVGLQWKDLFDSRISKSPRSVSTTFSPGPVDRPAAPRSAGQKRILNIYPYVDEKGQLLYENVRFYPKDFRQRHFDGKGSVVWNLDGVKRVPYRLPQLLSSIRQSFDVFLCEGEKDADALRELGFTASNFKGWNADMNRYIYEANIIIVADHDLPGLKHADDAARVIREAAKSLKVLDVFMHLDLPPKHGADISDLIRTCVQDEGMTREEIAERIGQMAGSTEEWRDVANANRAEYFLLKGGDEWMEEAKLRPIPRMLFGKFWFEGELCILFADTNVGKSILAVQIGDAVAKGRPFAIQPDSSDTGTGVLNRESNESDESSISQHIEAEAQKIVYFDFELTAKQFESRFAERT